MREEHEITLEEIAKKFKLKGNINSSQCEVAFDVLYMVMEVGE